MAGWWWHRAAPGSTNPGAALLTGRCLFPYYTLPGFFSFIQPDPGCAVNLFALWVLYVKIRNWEWNHPWRLMCPLSCTRNWVGPFPEGLKWGHNNVWQDWMLCGSSCCRRVFQLCKGRGGMHTAHPYIKTSFHSRRSVCLFIWKNLNIWHIWRPLEASQQLHAIQILQAMKFLALKWPLFPNAALSCLTQQQSASVPKYLFLF